MIGPQPARERMFRYSSIRVCVTCRQEAKEFKTSGIARRCGRCGISCCRHNCRAAVPPEKSTTCWVCRRNELKKVVIR